MLMGSINFTCSRRGHLNCTKLYATPDCRVLNALTIYALKKQAFKLHDACECAAYTGLHVDIDRIRLDNETRTDAQRKSGLIIWSGRK